MQRAEGRAVAARCRHALFVEEIGVNGLDLVDLSRAHADAVVDHEAAQRRCNSVAELMQMATTLADYELFAVCGALLAATRVRAEWWDAARSSWL